MPRRRVPRIRPGVLIAAVTVVVAALLPPAAAADPGRRSQTVDVTVTERGFSLSTDVVRQEVVTLRISARTDASIAVLQPRNATLQQVLDAVSVQLDAGEPTPALLRELARSTRFLNSRAAFFGGADLTAGSSPVEVTLRLPRGVYHVANFVPGGAIQTEQLRVVGSGGGLPQADARVDIEKANHGVHHGHVFDAPDVLPARGTVLFRNQNDVVHFADLLPVRPGTTDAQVQALFDAFLAGNPPPPEADPFLPGPFAGMNALSTGSRATLAYDLPAGTYILLCFIADEVNGLPHAFLGLHKVVTLR